MRVGVQHLPFYYDYGGQALKKVILIPLVLSLALSGCSGLSDADAKRKEVEEYNTLVSTTVDTFTEVKTYAETSQRDLLGYLKNNTEWDNLSAKEEGSENVTPEVLDGFGTASVVYNDYFTSIGASAVRQVLVLRGDGYIMYATVLWGKDEVISLTRRVVEA